MICACSVGTDGLTPFRRLKGRKFGTPHAGFGDERTAVGESEKCRGKTARILPQVVSLHRGTLRQQVSLRSDGQEGHS